jgi:hypothetical protein
MSPLLKELQMINYRMSGKKKDPEKQFNEVDYDMHVNDPWTREDIDTMTNSLAKSYKILPAEITHKFEKIDDVNDDDRFRCVYIVYYMKREMVLGGQSKLSDRDRQIFKVKMPLSEEMKRKAEELRRRTSPYAMAPALRPLMPLPTGNAAAPNVRPAPVPIVPKIKKLTQ